MALIYRRTQNMEKKQEIAAKAVRYIRDGMMLFLDASSTAAQIIPLLGQFQNLAVVTNSPQNSIAMAEMQIRSHCTGGRLLNNSLAYVGPGTGQI